MITLTTDFTHDNLYLSCWSISTNTQKSFTVLLIFWLRTWRDEGLCSAFRIQILMQLQTVCYVLSTRGDSDDRWFWDKKFSSVFFLSCFEVFTYVLCGMMMMFGDVPNDEWSQTIVAWTRNFAFFCVWWIFLGCGHHGWLSMTKTRDQNLPQCPVWELLLSLTQLSVSLSLSLPLWLPVLQDRTHIC